MNEPSPSSSVLIDLVATCRHATVGGPQWSFESSDLDLTLLAWTTHQVIAPYVNDEVDVMLLGVDGIGEVGIDDAMYRLHAGQALLIAKGARRSFRSVTTQWSYLSVHRRRRGLWPTFPQTT